jgi:hypothetical protein
MCVYKKTLNFGAETKKVWNPGNVVRGKEGRARPQILAIFQRLLTHFSDTANNFEEL